MSRGAADIASWSDRCRLKASEQSPSYASLNIKGLLPASESVTYQIELLAEWSQEGCTVDLDFIERAASKS
jgi:hypothetical protein